MSDAVVPYFLLWKWRSGTYRTVYTAEHVNTAVWMLERHGVPRSKILCITDDPTGVTCRTHEIWTDLSSLLNISGGHLPSCYRRLRAFDPETLERMGVPRGARVCSFDLDVVILQNFLKLFQRPEKFVGWKVPGTQHRVVMNGSMFMWTAGELGWLWNDFDPVKSPKAAVEAGYMGSDQGYLSHRLVSQSWIGGWWAATDGVLSYRRDVINKGQLPKHTRVVFFPGKYKPWDTHTRRESNWILRYVPRPEQLAAQQETQDVVH